MMMALRWLLLALVVASGAEGVSNGNGSPLDQERSRLHVIEVHESLDAAPEDVLQSGLAVPMPMAGASGDEYVCFATLTEEEKAARKAKLESDQMKASPDQVADTPAKKLAAIEQQLAALKGSCFIKRMGYWSYKVCPFGKIFQIHFEGNAEKLSFELGTFAGPAGTLSLPQEEQDAGGVERKNAELKSSSNGMQVVHAYRDGTNGRSTRLFFECAPSADNVVIRSILEPEVHSYNIYIQTPLACLASPEWQVKQLLAPLSGRCFRKAEAWWTYELCYEKHLRQFHKEKDGRLTEYMLGLHSEEINQDLEKAHEALTTDKHTKRPVYQQRYHKGTRCDLKDNLHRTATILYFCKSSSQVHDSPHASSPTVIHSITESPSCNYIVQVHTPLLCSHPFFKNSQAGAKKLAISKVHCFPENVYAEHVRKAVE